MRALSPFVLLAALAICAPVVPPEAAEKKRETQAEDGIALKQLGIAPIDSLSRLIALGCRDVLNATKKVRATKSVTENGKLYRRYEYLGMKMTTESESGTIVFGSSIPASAFAAWGIAAGSSSARMALADFEQRFGRPSQVEEGKAWFTTVDDPMAILFVVHERTVVKELNWSC